MGLSNHRPTTLIVDFGGVLTSDVWDSAREYAQRVGLAPDSIVHMLRRDSSLSALFADLERGDIDQATFCARFAEGSGLPPTGLIGNILKGLRPNKDILDAVAVLKETGVRLGVLSNSSGSGSFDPYDGYKMDSWADAMVISHKVRMRKPEEGMYSLILERLGVEASDTVFVDDVEENLIPATALGMGVIHHRSNPETIRALELAFGRALRR